MAPTMLRSLTFSAVMLAAACATAEPVDGPDYQQLLAEMHALQRAQRTFTANNQVPQQIDFPGQGRVVVRQLSLDGYPGNSYVRCRFHYVNTTGRPVVRSLVSLDVLDDHGNLIASQQSVCIFPTPRAIYGGTFFADELRTQTHGVHTQTGWSWRLTCRTEFEDPAEGDSGN